MAAGKDESWKTAKTMYEFSANDIDGNEVSLEKYKGHVCVVVNVASAWGLTDKNYKQLVELDQKFADSKGLRILAFPCNQFNSQEPKSNAEIKEFAQGKYGAKFDLFAKINVNGDDAIPLYKFLKIKQKGTFGNRIKWNFTKFIVNKEGIPVKRYSPTTDPKDMVKDLEKYF